jgi:glycosyltransferase involved in cell wall biosynthesis
MRILFVTSLLGKEYGGAEVSTNLLLARLTERGCDVLALTTRNIQKNERLVPLGLPIEIPKRLLTLGNSQLDYLLARKIKEKIRAINPDIIHVQDTYILPAIVLANKNLKVPIVATVRNSVLDCVWDLMFSFPISTILKRRNKTIVKSLNKLDSIIAVSEYIKTELVQRGIDRGKVFPIYNLPPIFKNTEEKPANDKTDSAVHLFAPGILASFKGFSVLIDAMKKVTECAKNVDLTIAGDGPEKKKLEKMTEKSGLRPFVKFVGKVPNENLSQLYMSSDIVVFPSIYPEPFGRVALEAMFYGKPVVASRVGGIPEVIANGETGLLVPQGNPEELAEAVLTLVRDSEMRVSLGRNGKSVVRTKFSPERIVDQHLQVYSNARQHAKI